METADVVVVGGGIAGVSVACELSRAGQHVVLVETEPTLAFHTTGRSAAQYLENYGNDVVRRLTLASRPFFEHAYDPELWSPRAFLRVGRDSHLDTLRAEASQLQTLVPSTEFLDGDAAREIMPVLHPEVEGALYEPGAMELDVAAIHQTFVRGLRASGGEVRPSTSVTALERAGDRWRVALGDAAIETPVVVNAAGAWGDELGDMAGIGPMRLYPLRRTVAVTTLPDDIDAAGWPLVAFEADDGSMDGYCKPEPGGLLVSPADETLSAPCDARPEEIDVARGLDTLARWTTLEPRHVSTTWAGLRSFTADRTPVAGFAPSAPGFFWLIGQGGVGIQTAPALARAAAGLILEGDLPAELLTAGLAADDLCATRPGLAGALLTGH
jgi:D-arginine dehydrogenase